jgi:hypothetical protein
MALRVLLTRPSPAGALILMVLLACTEVKEVPIEQTVIVKETVVVAATPVPSMCPIMAAGNCVTGDKHARPRRKRSLATRL